MIVFDALRIPSPPGTVRCLTRNEILAAPLSNPRLSPHDPGLREALLTAEFFGEAPRDVLLVGIVPKQVELGTELSPEVARSLAPGRRGRGVRAPPARNPPGAAARAGPRGGLVEVGLTW